MATKQELALLSLRVYSTPGAVSGANPELNRPALPDGWVEQEWHADGALGFSYGVYTKGSEVVIAYTGTNAGIDWLSNGTAGLGAGAPQVYEAALAYVKAKEAYGSNITFTGHSLGGGLASVMAVWFDRPATVFDEAPFQLTAQNLAVATVNKLALLAQGYSDLSFASYIHPLQFLLREQNVVNYYTEGEALYYLRLVPGMTVVGLGQDHGVAFGSDLMTGGFTGKSVDLHSQALLTAGLISEPFRQSTLLVKETLPIIFDRDFYYTSTQSVTDENILINLIRGEQAAGDKLFHLAVDINRTAGLDTALKKALLGQAIEWYYWQPEAYSGSQFFTPGSDLLQYTIATGEGLAGALNKAGKYVAGWLAPIVEAHGGFFTGTTVSYDQWNVATGSGGSSATAMNAGKSQIFVGAAGGDTFTAGAQDDMMLGGGGADKLTGGAGDDDLYGGAGSDTLEGGEGWDSYWIEGADRVVDSDGRGSIADKSGNRISGFIEKRADGSMVFLNNPSITVTGGSDLTLTLTDGSTVTIEGFDDGELGLHFSDPNQPPETSVELAGDLQLKDFDPAADGIQTQQDAWGNAIRDPNIPMPDREDFFYDSPGNDDIRTYGGFDYIEAYRGGDDYLDGGAGNDIVGGRGGKDLVIGGAGNDLLRGDAGNDKVYGGQETSLEDAIAAEDGPASGVKGDFIDGGAGNDVVIGDAGNDALNGGQGDDVIVGGAGNDELDGDLETDVVTMSWTTTRSIQIQPDGSKFYHTLYSDVGFTTPTTGGDDAIAGGGGDDWVRAGHGDDYVDGGSGNDVIFGHADNDDLFGGSGNDIVNGDGAGVAAKGNDYLDGEDGDDELYADGGSDALFGGAGNDTMAGDAAATTAGSDYLDGEAGNDLMFGAALDDRLFGGDGNDTMQGDSGSGLADGSDYLNGEGGDDRIFGEGGRDTVDGGSGNDTLFGGNDGDTVSGGTGNDQVQGQSGDDFLSGDDGADVVAGQDGNDAMQGGLGDDTLLGGAGDDVMAGGAGNDVYIYDGLGNDSISDTGGTQDVLILSTWFMNQLTLGVGSLTITGPNGAQLHLEDFDPLNPLAAGGIEWFQFADNTVVSKATVISTLGFRPTGTPGTDQLSGTALGDTIQALGGHDVVDARAGNDTIDAGDGSDEVRAGDGGDLVGGGAGDDLLYGDGGNDTVNGGSGTDVLHGGTGNDQLAGGDGDDYYLFLAGDGADVATDASGLNHIVLGEGLVLDTIVFSRQGNDLQVAVKNSADRLVVKDWFTSGSAFADVMLGDGSVLDHAAVEAAMPTNQVPLTSTDNIAVTEDTVVSGGGNALANDSDPEGRTLAVTNPGTYTGAYGTLTLQADGGFSYALANTTAAVQSLRGGQAVTDTFAYTASDQDPAGAGSAQGQIVVTVQGRNDLPVLGADAAATFEDGATTSGNVLANDSDIDAGTVLAIVDPGVRAGTYGSLSVSADGSWSYTPANSSQAVQALAAGQVVADLFTFQVGDGTAQVAGSLAVQLTGVNDAPVVASAIADQSASANTSWTWTLPAGTFRDVDAGDTLAFSASLANGAALPSWLTFSGSTQTFSGRVPRDATGSIEIQVQVTDASGVQVSDIFILSFSGGGGNNGGGSSGNNGVGNGEDGPPAGQDDSFNDGPGTGPGHPGAQGGNGNGNAYGHAIDIGRIESMLLDGDALLGALPTAPALHSPNGVAAGHGQAPGQVKKAEVSYADVGDQGAYLALMGLAPLEQP